MTIFKTHRRAFSGAIALAGFAVAATAQAQPSAETFTFTSQANSEVSVGSDGTGPNPYFAAYVTGTFTTAFAGGENVNGNYTCISMTQPPAGKIFDFHMLCDGTDSRGTYSITMGCTVLDSATNDWSCIGGIYGKSGGYSGKRGTLTNRSVGGEASGTGQWYR